MQDTMERVRIEIAAMESQRAEALATITNMRAQMTEISAVHVKKVELITYHYKYGSFY